MDRGIEQTNALVVPAVEDAEMEVVDLTVDVDFSEYSLADHNHSDASKEVVVCEHVSDTEYIGKLIAPPAVGMVFPTIENVDSYYRSYGKQEGFGVVRVVSACREIAERRTKVGRNSTWKRECHGKYEARKTVKARKMGVGKKGVQVGVGKSKKCGCTAMIHAFVNEEGEWVIKNVVLEHKNHTPTPILSKYISKYLQEELTNEVRKRLFNDVDAGITVP